MSNQADALGALLNSTQSPQPSNAAPNPTPNPTTPNPTPNPTPTTNDPIGALLGSTAEPHQNDDPIGALTGQQASVDSPVSQPPPVADPDESTIGKVWDWANRGLIDFTKIGTRQGAGPIEQGIEKGAEKVATQFTSPLSVALLVTTGGLGSLAEGAGADALEAVAPDIAAAVKPAAATISKLMQTGFTGQQIYSVTQAVPRVRDAIRAGDTEAASEYLTQAIFNGVAAATSAKSLAARAFPTETGEDFVFPGDKEAIGAHQHEAEKANLAAKTFENANKALINNKPLDMAAQLYHEAGGDLSVLEKQRQEILDSPNTPDQLKGKYDALLKQAMNLPDSVKAISGTLRVDYAADYARGQQIGLFGADREPTPNYAGQHQYNPEDASDSTVKPSARMGAKSPDFAKARSFPTLTDAVKAGYEPAEIGLAGSRADYIRQFGQSEGLRAAENTLQQVKASDSAPIGVNPAKVRVVDGTRVIAMPQGVDLAKLADADRIVTANGKQYLDVSDYKPGPDNFNLFRVSQTAFDENGNSIPIFEKANLLIHPDYVKPVTQAFQDTSWFRQNPFWNNALKLSTGAKKTLLSFSPFHWATEGERGLQMGLNPAEVFRPPQIDPNGLAMEKGTRYGLTLLGDRASRGLADEGVSSGGGKLINNIPVLGGILKSVEDKLFGDYIPRWKAASFEKVADQLSKKNPDWSEAEVYSRAAKITNGAFGGINWRQLGVSLSSQDALRLAFLAPDFTGSQILFAHAGMEPGGSVVWQSMARIALYNMAVAQTINLLYTGSVHMDHPFSVVSQDGKKIYSIRTMPEDIAHALTDPRGFLSARLNPVTIRPAVEFLTGKDEMGRTASYDQQLSDLLKNAVPITGQGILFSRPDQTAASQVMKGLGVTTTPNRTTAEELAIRKASAHSPDGAVPSGQLKQHQFANSLIDKLRSGQITSDQVMQATLNGQISSNQAKRIIKEAAMPPIVARVHSLPLNDALDVYNVATQQEKAELYPVLAKKVAEFHKTGRKTKTPEQIAFINGRINNILVPPQNAPASIPDSVNIPVEGADPLQDLFNSTSAPTPDRVAQAISVAEGAQVPGSIPVRANNPGDLAEGDLGHGTIQSIGPGANKITIFPTTADGWAALNRDIKLKLGRNPDLTWYELGRIYDPADWQHWAENAAKSVHASPNDRVANVYNLTSQNVAPTHIYNPRTKNIEPIGAANA